MTADEMRQEFDLLYDNIMSNKAPGLTAYEVSRFLSQAQLSIVTALYKGLAAESFEETESNAGNLDALMRQVTLTEQSDVDAAEHITPGSVFYELPSDVMFRTYESCVATVGGCGDLVLQVRPVTQDEYWRTARNPFRGTSGTAALRLSYSDGNGRSYSEIVSKHPVRSYLLRYLRHPDPIITEDLPDGLTIDGKSKKADCMLDRSLHRTIVLEAANAAKAVWG